MMKKKIWLSPAITVFEVASEKHILTMSDDYNKDGTYNSKNRNIDRFKDEGDI